MAALKKKAVVDYCYNLVSVYFQLIHNILLFMCIEQQLGDNVIIYFPLNLQHPLPVLWGAGQVLAAVNQDKKMEWVSFLRHL